MTDKEFLTKAVDDGFWWSKKPKVYIPSPSGNKFGKIVDSEAYGVSINCTEIGEIPKNQYTLSKVRQVIEDYLINLRLEKINILLNDR